MVLTRAMFVAAACVACASTGPHGGSEGASGRDHECRFETLRGQPGPEYVEIARINLEGSSDFGAGRYRDTRRFTSMLHEMVCELGGDAVKPEMDAYGVTRHAVVFRRVREGTPGSSDAR